MIITIIQLSVSYLMVDMHLIFVFYCSRDVSIAADLVVKLATQLSNSTMAFQKGLEDRNEF